MGEVTPEFQGMIADERELRLHGVTITFSVRVSMVSIKIEIAHTKLLSIAVDVPPDNVRKSLELLIYEFLT